MHLQNIVYYNYKHITMTIFCHDSGPKGRYFKKLVKISFLYDIVVCIGFLDGEKCLIF